MSLKHIFNEAGGAYYPIGSVPWNVLVQIGNDIVNNTKAITFTMDAVQGSTIVQNVGSVNALFSDGLKYEVQLTPLFTSDNPAIFIAGSGLDGGFAMTSDVDYFILRSPDLLLSNNTTRYQNLTNIGINEYNGTNTYQNTYIGTLVLTPETAGQQYIYMGGGMLQKNLFKNGNRYYFGFSSHPSVANSSDNSIMVDGGTYSSIINFSYS